VGREAAYARAEGAMSSGGGLAGLVSRVPHEAELALPSEAAEVAADGRVVHPMAIALTRRAPGADPDRGQGALDQLALRRARGATHLLLPETSRWWLARYPELDAFLSAHCRVMAENDAGVVWSLPPAPPPGPPKVVCIGLMKTATSSLHHALTDLGLRSMHWGGPENFHGVLNAQRDGARLLRDIGEHFDAYSDIGPLSARFDLVELQYPGSKFILTVRDVDDWVHSRRKHVERNQRERAAGIYTGINVGVDEESWRREWHAHLERITTHFAGRSNLLVLDLCADPRWDQLVAFLDRPMPAIAFPRDLVHRTTATGVPLHLACRTDGSLVLIEGERTSDVDANQVGPALRRVLGSPTSLPDVGRSNGEPIAYVSSAGVVALAEWLPDGTELVVPDELGGELAECGVPIHPIAIEWSPRGRGPDPDRGRGALDLVAKCRARGATHLLLPESSSWWLARYQDLAEYLARRARVVATNDAGVVWSLPPCSPLGPPKLFCIGVGTTGRRSLHDALLELGLRSVRTGGRATFHAVLRAQRDGDRLLRDVGEQFDAYRDIRPLSWRFDLLDLQYPGSKFIVTVDDTDESEPHVDRVTTYFAGRDDLLVLDLCANPRWDELADFLDRPVPAKRFPDERRRRLLRRRIAPSRTSGP
jgi:hypothetical protein